VSLCVFVPLDHLSQAVYSQSGSAALLPGGVTCWLQEEFQIGFLSLERHFVGVDGVGLHSWSAKAGRLRHGQSNGLTRSYTDFSPRRRYRCVFGEIYFFTLAGESAAAGTFA
jgi:hypothetical protein